MVILASGSPRRKELLAKLEIPFSIAVSGGEEFAGTTVPEEAVLKLSKDKAWDVTRKLDCPEKVSLVIGADTVVAFQGRILGKPADEQDALETLMQLQGNVHQVYTGVTLFFKQDHEWKCRSFYEKTDVEFYPVSKEELIEYIKTGEPMDKAGSYGIQGTFGKYVKKICGDYNNVVGLPLGRLFHEMKILQMI